MIAEAVAALRCPRCRGALQDGGAALRCAEGHSFDVARHGYVSFLVGRPTGLVGDDGPMIDARARFLGAGHFDPLSTALVAAAAGAPPGLALEVGAGTAWHLARVLDAEPGRHGLAVDLSREAARRAARAHARAAAAVADLRAPLPLADGCAALILDVFAPRSGAEMGRVALPGARLLVVTPGADHLAELRRPLGLLGIDPDKEQRVADALSPWFERESGEEVRWTMRLDRRDVAALAAMGPTARHVSAEAIAARAATLPEPVEVTGACLLEAWRPRA